MESNNTSSKRTFVLGLAGGLAVAAALGAAFLLGGGRDGDARAASTPAATSTAADTAKAPEAPANGVPAGTTDEGAGEPGETNDTQDGGNDNATSTATSTATATATATPSGGGCKFCQDGGGLAVPPTATATPGAVCKFCVDGGLAAEPTKVDPCPLCDDPVFGVEPPDTTAPSIDDIAHVQLCNQTLYVDFTVSEPAKVWLSYVYKGIKYATDIQHVTGDASIAADLSQYGWGVVLIDSYTLHAEDYAGNVTNAGPFDMPQLEISC